MFSNGKLWLCVNVSTIKYSDANITLKNLHTWTSY